MKIYDDYCREYEVVAGWRNSFGFFIEDKDTWISKMWQYDVDFLPGEPASIELLRSLKRQDERLYKAVFSGIPFFSQLLAE